MTTTAGAATNGAATTPDIRVIEQFLYREARFADAHAFDDWEGLWTDDGLYWVPANGDDIDPMRMMSIIHDNRSRIRTRIKQLNTGRRLSQEPRSRLRRVVSNVEVIGTHGEDIVVEANFVLVESRERATEVWAGRYTYRLRMVEGELRMAYKKVALVDNSRAIATLSFLI